MELIQSMAADLARRNSSQLQAAALEGLDVRPLVARQQQRREELMSAWSEAEQIEFLEAYAEAMRALSNEAQEQAQVAIQQIAAEDRRRSGSSITWGVLLLVFAMLVFLLR
ncbi:hypothetical protein D3C81_317920 [compost metagenome]